MREARETNDPKKMREAAAMLRSAGYPSAGAELDAGAAQLERATAPDSPHGRELSKIANAAVDAAMPPKLAEQVKRALQFEGNPDKLEALADAVAALGHDSEAGALRDKASVIRAKLEEGRALEAVEAVVSPERAAKRNEERRSPGLPTTPPATATTATETKAKAEKVTEEARRAAEAAPGAAPQLADAAKGAAKAAEGAKQGDAGRVAEGAQDVARAASEAVSAETKEKAREAVDAAREAAQTPTRENVEKAGAAVVDAAESAVIDKEREAKSVPAPERGTRDEVRDVALRLAANLLATTIYNEDRALVTRYQELEGGTKTTAGRAGVADGLYGPKTALAMLRHMPSVPEPRYWPKDAKKKAIAQGNWSQLLAHGKVSEVTAARA